MTGIRFLKAAAVCLATLGVAMPQVPAMADSARTGSTVRPQKSTLPDIALTTGGTLSGRIVDHTGKPREGAEVTLFQGKKPLTATITNQEGVYSFKHVKGGVYGITSGNTDATFRVWTERTAPPSAKEHALLVMGENGARGQWGAVDPTLVLLTAGVITAVILSAITLSRIDDSTSTIIYVPASP
ncbi:MAG TPA: carboxypeptidase-like regulatory domain-containing protein [Schlesneria sp.]|jgi:hypothetical protein